MEPITSPAEFKQFAETTLASIPRIMLRDLSLGYCNVIGVGFTSACFETEPGVVAKVYYDQNLIRSLPILTQQQIAKMRQQLIRENSGIKGSAIVGEGKVSGMRAVEENILQLVTRQFLGGLLANQILPGITPLQYSLIEDENGPCGITMSKAPGLARSLAFMSDPNLKADIIQLRKGGVAVDTSPFSRNCMYVNSTTYQLIDLSISY